MIKKNKNDTTHKSEINVTMAFIKSLWAKARKPRGQICLHLELENRHLINTIQNEKYNILLITSFSCDL